MTKKRANEEGSIRKRKDGRWEGRYTAGYDQDGKRIIKNVLGRTQAEVKAKLSVAIMESQQLDVSRSGEYTGSRVAAAMVRAVCQAQHPPFHSRLLPPGHGGIHHPPNRNLQAEQAYQPGDSEALQGPAGKRAAAEKAEEEPPRD